MSYHPLRELTFARVREFLREPEAIFWVYGFPILLAVGLGIAFRTRGEEPVRVWIETPAQAIPSRAPEAAAVDSLEKDPRFRVERKTPEECRAGLALGRSDLVIQVGEEVRFEFDPRRLESALARQWADAAIQTAAGRRDAVKTAEAKIEEHGSRYIDFLIPGLIGMNLMGGGLWGVGFVIVDLRVRKLLKRFLATPMRKRDFLLSILGSRLLFLVPEVVLLLLVGRFVFDVPNRGSLFAVAAVVAVAALGFSGLGLLIASRANKIETISGLMNLVMLPMWLLSGIFFSSERFPDAIQPFIHALPLTAANDALRAVMLEGRSLASQASELLLLAAWGLGSFALSMRWFRWI